jgi:hypothetical protein
MQAVVGGEVLIGVVNDTAVATAGGEVNRYGVHEWRQLHGDSSRGLLLYR